MFFLPNGNHDTVGLCPAPDTTHHCLVLNECSHQSKAYTLFTMPGLSFILMTVNTWGKSGTADKIQGKGFKCCVQL